MAVAIAEKLKSVDPENAALRDVNAKNVSARLWVMSNKLKDSLIPLSPLRFSFFYDEYQYFEKRYGLNSVGGITVSPEKTKWI